MSDDLLHQYFSNACSPAEARQVLDWFDTEAGRAFVARRLDSELLRADWHAPPNAQIPEAEHLLARLREQMAPAEVASPQPTPRWQIWRPLSQPAYQWAAACLAGLALLMGGYGYWINTSETLIQTAYGQTQTVTLPDQSVVTMNGNSRVQYGKRSWGDWPFGAVWATGQSREVWLAGEAFFKVTHQKQHEPFVVHLPNKLNVEVLGTEFNVMARNSHAQVVLNHGKIRLNRGEQTKDRLVMIPGDMVYADTKEHVYYRKRVNPAVVSSWQHGKLRFEGTSLQEVAQMLEETYGVKVVFAQAGLKQQTLSGTIPNNNIQTILSGLSTLFEVRITQKNNQIIIQQP
jgi:transmembrane sensor